MVRSFSFLTVFAIPEQIQHLTLKIHNILITFGILLIKSAFLCLASVLRHKQPVPRAKRHSAFYKPHLPVLTLLHQM